MARIQLTGHTSPHYVHESLKGCQGTWSERKVASWRTCGARRRTRAPSPGTRSGRSTTTWRAPRRPGGTSSCPSSAVATRPTWTSPRPFSCRNASAASPSCTSYIDFARRSSDMSACMHIIFDEVLAIMTYRGCHITSTKHQDVL